MRPLQKNENEHGPATLRTKINTQSWGTRRRRADFRWGERSRQGRADVDHPGAKRGMGCPHIREVHHETTADRAGKWSRGCEWGKARIIVRKSNVQIRVERKASEKKGRVKGAHRCGERGVFRPRKKFERNNERR